MNRFSLRSVADILSDSELQLVLGGRVVSGQGSGRLLGGYDDEAGITCGKNNGQCWKCIFVMKGEFTGWCSQATGDPKDFCPNVRCDWI